MNLKQKAYCGDGLLRLIVGETCPHIGVKINFESNACLKRCWQRFSKLKPEKETDWEYGTMMEAAIYDLFLKEGYPKTKKFVIETIINPTITWHNEKNKKFSNILNQYVLIESYKSADMDKESRYELQKIDCNCNDCKFMERDFEKRKSFDHLYEGSQNASHRINYGNCSKFSKPVSFIPNHCQLETQECFVHRKD